MSSKYPSDEEVTLKQVMELEKARINMDQDFFMTISNLAYEFSEGLSPSDLKARSDLLNKIINTAKDRRRLITATRHTAYMDNFVGYRNDLQELEKIVDKLGGADLTFNELVMAVQQNNNSKLSLLLSTNIIPPEDLGAILIMATDKNNLYGVQMLLQQDIPANKKLEAYETATKKGFREIAEYLRKKL